MKKKTVLMTGCSSRFGKLTAKTFREKGWNVIATMRTPEKETELTEAIALEYKPLNIIAKTVLSGAYPTTPFNANTDDDLNVGDEELCAYAQNLRAHIQGIAERMAAQGGTMADPQEVGDKIYECTTSETPVHNPVGADAEMLSGMMSAGSRQDFLDKMEEMLLPPQ
jgi:NAD(P)-dependent dehydrogenase (short-subunit alcohol dehydrogenase family)